MEIKVESLSEGASPQKARGTVVIVDVFRAFTTAAVAFARGGQDHHGGGAARASRALKERKV